MTKLLVMPPHKEELENILEYADAILVGITNFSVNFTEISEDELKEVVEKVKEKKKEVFISLNKNMHNGDLESLERLLKKCQEYQVDGIFYYDVAVLQIHHRLSLDLPLIWSAEHLATNSHTIIYWEQHGIQGVFLSNEITKREILEIQESIHVPCIVQVFGYLPMYVSKRLAISNYLKHFQLKTDSKEFYLWKEENTYPILERKIGTEIYSSFIQNSITEYLEYQKHNMEYVFISGAFLPIDKFQRVLELFSIVTDTNREEVKEELNTLFPNNGLGFLYKETVYQVKKNEK